MIIGLTGPNGAGKGVVAEFLKQRGFMSLSLSDVLRDELKSRNMSVTRDHLVLVGNELRAESGHGVLAQKVLKRMDHDKNYVVDSIRNPSEVHTLKQRSDFILVLVDAALETRFKRIRDRSRESDPQTFEEFVRLEHKEKSSINPADQQLDKTALLADVTVNNDGALEALHDQIVQALKRYGAVFSRPNWDAYFMNIAKVVAMRSNCIKRKVAAVVVKERRIISTGYNGTPRGVKNCMEGGCPRCNSFAQQGTQLEECLCSHAEENAITQAAYHGVSIKDAVLYSTYSPCLMCTKMIINSGIRTVVYSHDYPLNDVAMNLLQGAGVIVSKM